MPLFGLAQDQETVKTQGTQITISSKGADVRSVLHDLFTQAKKNFVLENLSRSELYLSLNTMDFDETLEIVCRLANLTYEIQNDIYYFTKVRPIQAPSTRPANSATPPNPAAEAAKIGKLSEAVLKRSVSGTYTKQDLRAVIKNLADQAKVVVEIDDRIPLYKLDFKLNPTSLGYALKTIADRLKLEVVFSDRQTLLLQPKGAKPIVEKFEISD
ncbi:MAG: hypothetical protein JNK63_10275 [Chthonomonas sp.]|nr:hypothetical protein [Chthonomonas sp.]